MKVTKAIIPAAGFGTRFLPQTKAMPKEMLPIVDKPVIQIVVEELVEAGVTDIIIVTGWHKRALEDHFDTHPELEALLEKSGKTELLKKVREVNRLANFYYVRQKGPVGNATPVANAAKLVEGEPFFVLWGDDFFLGQPSRVRQMVALYEQYQATIIGCIKTSDPEATKKYGFAKGKEVASGVIEMEEIVEKPGPDKAPSDLATISGLYSPGVLPYFQRVVEEIQDREPVYVDALTMMIKEGREKVYAAEIKGAKYYDTGSKLGYLKTLVELGLEHEEVGADFREYLKKAAQDL